MPTDIVARDDDGGARPRLVAVWEGGSVAVDLPRHGVLVVGRGDDADITIPHTSVSRRHAEIRVGPPMTVEDLGSANGTWVARVKLAPRAPVPLAPGAVVEIGAAMVAVRDAPSARAPARDGRIVVADPKMQEIAELVDLVAQSRLSVILLGETGVGKEVFAERIHARSARAGGPLVKVNCAALVESLLEAELFGYERGAFTGAHQAKPGLLEAANGGTIFLDEAGELPPTTQAKLLRVLESGEVTRIGSVKPRAIDVRVVAATNRNLKELVAAGRFRQDLYFRLDGASIRIPPLRDRPGEIAVLAEELAKEACVEQGRPPLALTPAAVARLTRHAWPGNVRELRNVIARSVVFCRGAALDEADLQLGDVGAPAGASPPSADPRSGAHERVLEALEASAGNQTRAAKMLGISRRTFVKKLDQLGVPRPRKRDG